MSRSVAYPTVYTVVRTIVNGIHWSPLECTLGAMAPIASGLESSGFAEPNGTTLFSSL